MKTIILCGGLGTRLREETESKPKPMVEIGNKPILWHIMKTYASYGHTEFVLALGYRGESIKRFFYDYDFQNRNFTVVLGKGIDANHDEHPEKGWRITLVDTGADSLKGCRLKRTAPFVDDDTFMVTYGDGVADVNINDLLAFHSSHGKIGTLTGVRPPSRFGEMIVKNSQVQSFTEKPQLSNGVINGGYFVFNRKIFDYVEDNVRCDLEIGPLEKLAQEGELMMYEHSGEWACMDTLRDLVYLNKLWDNGKAFWKKWSD